MQKERVDGEMFTVMKSRWFYISEKFLLGEHPVERYPMLVVRSRDRSILPQEVKRVLILNDMRLDGELQEEQGVQYYKLREVKDGNDKAIRGGVQRGGATPSH